MQVEHRRELYVEEGLWKWIRKEDDKQRSGAMETGESGLFIL